MISLIAILTSFPKRCQINPYNNLPTLVDRDLVLYDPNITMEYLDERFPHPPLLPVYPVARANARLFLHRIEKEWTGLIRTIELARRNNKRSPSATKELKEQLIAVAPIFEEMPYFMSEEFSLVDCTFAPILWRLPSLGVELPVKQTRGLQDYQYRIFNRDAFEQVCLKPSVKCRVAKWLSDPRARI